MSHLRLWSFWWIFGWKVCRGNGRPVSNMGGCNDVKMSGMDSESWRLSLGQPWVNLGSTWYATAGCRHPGRLGMLGSLCERPQVESLQPPSIYVASMVLQKRIVRMIDIDRDRHETAVKDRGGQGAAVQIKCRGAGTSLCKILGWSCMVYIA